MTMITVAWTAIGLLGAGLLALLGMIWSMNRSLSARIDGLGSRIDGLGSRNDSLASRIDALGARLDARLDTLSAQLQAQLNGTPGDV